ncbi:MAG TPA: ABC transporter ATP-binding protein [Candidatus Saccharimonas sp.]|nr:ABC transporter ATP-binding protein [Candidatus Saccharimonas sp.]
MNAAIELKGVKVVREKQTILSEVSLTLPAGKVVGLLGPSGAGKTTLIRVLVGLQKLAAGTATVLGMPAGSRKLRPQIGYSSQSLAVYPDLTVHENLTYFAAMTNASGKRVAEVLQEVSLEPQAKQLVRSLSGGQRARVSLGVALLGQPKLLVLDEPTVGLDPVLRTQLWDHFHRLAAAGTTLLVSSHVMDEAERCDELVLVRDGRVLSQGTPAGIKQSAGAQTIEQAFVSLIGGGK